MPKPSRSTSCFAAGLLTFSLAACASVPRIEMDAASSVRIQKIALLKVPPAPSPTVTNSGGAAGMFGAFGALVQVGMNASNGSAYADAVADGTRKLAPGITGSLAEVLARDGYQVVIPEQEPTVANSGDTVDLSSIQTDADAILAVWFTQVGYVSPPRSPYYQPFVVVKARMIDARSRGDLYFKTFSSGYDVDVKNSVYILTGGGYRYGTFQELMGSAAESFQGLVDATETVAVHVGADLRRR
jgi:hypothetical protein